jgi:thioredoxin-dependent peroxiredoxin
MPSIEEGQPFPSFSLSDQHGNLITNETLKGKKAVIYFYPKDDTPGCTTEACAFQEKLADFADATVLGVSPDDVKSHKKFADKFGLNFSLLADTEKSLSEATGTWVEKSMYGKKYMGVDRVTFLLDSEGIVRKVFPKVMPAGHSAEVRAALDLIQ